MYFSRVNGDIGRGFYGIFWSTGMNSICEAAQSIRLEGQSRRAQILRA